MGVNAGLPLPRGTFGLAGVDERRVATGDSGTCGRHEASLNAGSLGTREVLPDARMAGGFNREREGNCDGCAVEAARSPVLAFGGSAGDGWLAAAMAFGKAATDRLAPWRKVRCAALSGTVESLDAGTRAVPPIAPFAGWRLLLEAALAPAGGTSVLRVSGTAAVVRTGGR